MIYMVNVALPDLPGTRVRITTKQQAVAMNLYLFAVQQVGARGYVTDCTKDDVKALSEGLGARGTAELAAVAMLCDEFKTMVAETGMDPHINPVTGTREELPETFGDDLRDELELAFNTELRA